ncbi:cyclin-dependent kinase inhibitor 3-like [Oscarella lobularis]|uniref:cyclin-dependent kinase inhibitor 3-like n=1 Tax=Oscarella lobularis TaxID=121494 RepID=UPI003313B672
MVFLKSPSNDFDSSDEEDGVADQDKLDITWIPLPDRDGEALGLSALPGCRFRDVRRSLKFDLDTIVAAGIREVVVLCTDYELAKYKVSTLIYEYASAGLEVHHSPIEDGGVPSQSQLAEICEHLHKSKQPILIHCYGGLGRSCLVVALFMMLLNEKLSPDCAIEMMRSLRGPRAIQTVKQYNMIHGFRDLDVFSDWSSSPMKSA